MSAETQLDRRLAAQPARGSRRWLRLRARVAWRFLTARFSSSLTRRIVVLNLGGLVVLVVGFLLLDQFRADLIEARIQSLTIQADIIAAAISASATGDTDSITIDPDKLLQLAPGESVAPSQSDEDATQFSINPALVGPFLRRLVTPTHTRARIYDSDGRLLLDSRSFSARGAVVRSDLPDASDRSGFADRIIARLRGFFLTSVAPRADDPWATNGKTMPEVAGALQGKTQSLVRVNDEGETIVSVGVPIQRMMATRGALQLSTQGGDIDRVITSARLAQLRFFLVLAVVMLLLSLSLANTIAEPVRRLADAAERVRRGIRSRQQIPDFTARSDEIGHLSRALRDMTQALYNRLDAIESFAADVAHELEESADVAAQRARDAAAGERRTLARSADRRHAARRAAARSVDQRHLRRLPPRRGARARRGGPGRRRRPSAGGRGDGGGFSSQQWRPGRIVSPGQAGQERQRGLFCPRARFPSRTGCHQSH